MDSCADSEGVPDDASIAVLDVAKHVVTPCQRSARRVARAPGPAGTPVSTRFGVAT